MPFLAASGLWRVGFGDELVRIESRHNRAPARNRIFRNRHAAARRRAPAWRNGRADAGRTAVAGLPRTGRIVAQNVDRVARKRSRQSVCRYVKIWAGAISLKK